MALCASCQRISSQAMPLERGTAIGAYEMLSQLDEDAAILFQHLQRPLGTSLVAVLQQPFLLLRVLDLLPLVQRRPVVVDADEQRRRDSARPLRRFVALLDVIGEGEQPYAGRATTGREDHDPPP